MGWYFQRLERPIYRNRAGEKKGVMRFQIGGCQLKKQATGGRWGPQGAVTRSKDAQNRGDFHPFQPGEDAGWYFQRLERPLYRNRAGKKKGVM